MITSITRMPLLDGSHTWRGLILIWYFLVVVNIVVFDDYFVVKVGELLEISLDLIVALERNSGFAWLALACVYPLLFEKHFVFSLNLHTFNTLLLFLLVSVKLVAFLLLVSIRLCLDKRLNLSYSLLLLYKLTTPYLLTAFLFRIFIFIRSLI